MKRREFIAGLGSAAAWSMVVHGQQPTPVIGFLHGRGPESYAPQLAAFHRGLGERGYVEGQNVSIEYRWAQGQYEQLPAMAVDLVRRPVSLIVACTDQAAVAAKAATSNVSIVFVEGVDPVKVGLVASFSRPGGNTTGVDILTTGLEAKRLGLLHEVVPRAETIGVLLNPERVEIQNQVSQVKVAAGALGLHIRELHASNVDEIDAAFALSARERVAALLVAADVFFDSRRDQIVADAARTALPVMFQFREHAVAGGLMSYGIDLPDAYREAGVYAGRILKGEKPAELPVLQPTKFELVINLKTAKALGLTIPPGVLAIADEVIE